MKDDKNEEPNITGVQFHINLYPEVHEQLRRVAQITGLTVTMLINRALVQYYGMKVTKEVLKHKTLFDPKSIEAEVFNPKTLKGPKSGD